MLAARILPVIMSGGSGTRLWPLSTAERPKQFHALGGRASMIAETASRLRGTVEGVVFLDPVVIGSARHRDLIAAELAAAGIGLSALVLEPQGRNTAATAALAGLVAREIDQGALVLLMPADHVVARPERFAATVAAAAGEAGRRIVTFGIAPSGPETGFGYIEQGEELSPGVFAVRKFHEKPDRALAEDYIRRGGFSWNSGVFFFAPDVMIGEFANAPKPEKPDAAWAADILREATEALLLAGRDGVEIWLDEEAFARVPAESVDVAVMETTRRAAVAPCEIGWADVGSWAELWRLEPKDAAGNAVRGSATLLDVADTLVRAEGGVHVSVAGVSGLIVVATPTGVLVLPRERAQDVKKLLPKD
jgi:mannose-1-phosphate guanylyltransferase/mannose-6-phosphate isomerase